MEKCNEKCEVYSRVCGYFRPVSNWNHGKREEFKNRKTFQIVFPSRIGKSVLAALAVIFLLTACQSTAGKMTASASGKNLGLDGYVMYGEIETANPETVTPQGKIVIGRMTYKSRKVAIQADQKVPNTGYFKATKTKSLFGTEEFIIEYDFTAGSDADAEKAQKILEEKRREAENKFAENSDAEKKNSGTAAPEK